ncbi:MAG: methyltransferase domain-containing protein, partial [Pseudanabaenaceae cyanobacterium]
MARLVRVREHVNPLAIQYQKPTPPPDWSTVYGDWSLPLSLDLGSGQGEYLIQMGQRYPDRNFLGLEIRRPLVEYSNARREELGLSNVYFLFCNINQT